MSRIGKLPVSIKDVQVKIEGDWVVLKGPKGVERVFVRPEVEVSVGTEFITLKPLKDDAKVKAYYGLYRALLANAVQGVTVGFQKTLELNGVGYRASLSGNVLEMSLGYSHPIKFPIPDGVDIKVDKQTKVIVSGINKGQVGQVAAKLRGFRPPEPYLGKGVKYQDEVIRKKEGKSAGK